MFEYTCYDESGNSIDCLWQWDIERVIKIDIGELISAGNIGVNLSSKSVEKAIGAQCSVLNGMLLVNIPNTLLMENGLMRFYINSTTGISQSTIAYLELPIRKRDIPQDYNPDDYILDVATLEETRMYLGI